MGEVPLGSDLMKDDRAMASICGRATPLTTRLDAVVGWPTVISSSESLSTSVLFGMVEEALLFGVANWLERLDRFDVCDGPATVMSAVLY